MLLGERPRQQQQPAEFQYADNDHPVDNSLLDNLGIDNLYDSDFEDGEAYTDARPEHYLLDADTRQFLTPTKQRLRAKRLQGKGRISKKKNMVPSFRSRRIWQVVV